ncbi:hypothetical protein Plhal703r1_c04g0021051 [Plasmopara halstedii]
MSTSMKQFHTPSLELPNMNKDETNIVYVNIGGYHTPTACFVKAPTSLAYCPLYFFLSSSPNGQRSTWNLEKVVNNAAEMDSIATHEVKSDSIIAFLIFQPFLCPRLIYKK